MTFSTNKLTKNQKFASNFLKEQGVKILYSQEEQGMIKNVKIINRVRKLNGLLPLIQQLAE